jgi:hypothetical protein
MHFLFLPLATPWKKPKLEPPFRFIVDYTFNCCQMVSSYVKISSNSPSNLYMSLHSFPLRSYCSALSSRTLIFWSNSFLLFLIWLSKLPPMTLLNCLIAFFTFLQLSFTSSEFLLGRFSIILFLKSGRDNHAFYDKCVHVREVDCFFDK